MSGSHPQGELREPVLGRPRLRTLLEAAAGTRRVTTVVAGPGAGKTTLLTQWRPPDRVAWHTVTAEDGSLPTLVRSVTGALQAVAPTLVADRLLGIEGVLGPVDDDDQDSDRARAIATSLAQALGSHLDAPTWLVLDDLHLLGDTSSATRFVANLIATVPQGLHVVIASRREVPWRTGRLRVAGDLAELTGADLAFHRDEVAALGAAMGVADAAAVAGPLVTHTGGWAAVVSFTLRALATGDGLTVDHVLSRPANLALFDYLAEEVVDTLAPAQLGLLRRVAVLPWVTPELLARLGVEGPSAALFAATNRSIWATPVGDVPGAVAMTPLLRDHLRTNHPLDERERADVLSTAAEWYAARGELAHAITCLVDLGQPDLVRAALHEHGPGLLAAGHAQQLCDALEALPGDAMDDRLALLDAEAHQVLGDWEGALQRYLAIVPAEGPIPSEVAWRLGFLHHMQGRIDQALAAYGRGRLEGDAGEDAALLGWMASAHWLRGERERARDLADRALRLARAAADPRSLATAHTVLAMVAAMESDRAANDAHYQRALEHALAARDVLQVIRIRSNRGSHFLEEGRHEEALAELDEALHLADLTGFQLWRGMALSNRGEVLVRLGRLDEAMGELQRAIEIFRRLGSGMEAYPLTALGDVHAARGDLALARMAYEQAIALAEAGPDLQALVPALAGAAVLLKDDDPEQAAHHAKQALDVDSVLGRVRALLAGGWVALARDDVQRARDLADEAAVTARGRRDLLGMAEATHLQGRVTSDPAERESLLRQARDLWGQVGAPVQAAAIDAELAELRGGPAGAELAEHAAARLDDLGARAVARLARQRAQSLASDRDTPHVAICTLGTFSLTVDGRSVAPAQWKSRVARDVLAMLVAARGHPIHREILLERLWPDSDPAASGNRLSVALSTIRRLMDPGRAHGNDLHVDATRDTVALRLEHVHVDVETFLASARDGLARLRHGDPDHGQALLRLAEAAYAGDFLEDHPYAEWAWALREEARAQYLAVVTALATSEDEAGDHERAARRWLRLLERDIYNEPAHLGLVAAMAASGQHGTARRLYRDYVARMVEIDVEPATFPTT